MAIPPVALFRTKEWGLEVEVCDHHADNFAPRVRRATPNPDVQRLLDEIEASRNRDDATLSPWRPRHGDAPIIYLGALPGQWCLDAGRGDMKQAATMMHRQLYARLFEDGRKSGTQLDEVMLQRPRRWNADNPEAILGAWMAWIHPGPPTEFIGTYIVLYAWRTVSIFGLEPIPRRYGCGEEAGHRQTHYAACPVARMHAMRRCCQGSLQQLQREPTILRSASWRLEESARHWPMSTSTRILPHLQ